jgi:hypothetical protein
MKLIEKKKEIAKEGGRYIYFFFLEIRSIGTVTHKTHALNGKKKIFASIILYTPNALP